MKKHPAERHTLFHENKKKISHIVWHAATGDWPKWPEVIHHIDEDPFNNELGNLQLMSASEHQILHKTGKGGKNHHMYGKPRPEHSAFMMGENNPAWKGDDAKPKSKYMREWLARRRQLNG